MPTQPSLLRRSTTSAVTKKEIADLTRNDTNIVQIRRCRGCLVWHNFRKERSMGVQSFGGRGILVISDQRILAYLGTVRLFHLQWKNVQNDIYTHIDYSKDTLMPILCLAVDASLFPGVGDIEYRFETDLASLVRRRVQYLLRWYLNFECPPGTPRRYASEIWC